MKFRIGFVVLVIISLAACSARQVETAAPIPILSQTNTATALVASLTPTVTLTKMPFSTAYPIETMPVATLNAAATTEAIRINLINQFPELQDYFSFCSPGYCYGVQSSPNGQWIYLTNFNTLDLFSADSERIGKYSFYDIYGYKVNYSEGLINGTHWSKDGQYLYISANPGGDGGPEPYLGYISALVRVDLKNGTWKNMEISGSFEFSPNDEYIIYSGHKGQIQVQSLSTGQQQIYSPSKYFPYFGNYVWSPDDSKVVFVGAPEDWYANDSKFVIFMVDVESRAILQLYESSLPFYFPIAWVEADKVIVKKFNQTDKWTLDLSANPPTINP